MTYPQPSATNLGEQRVFTTITSTALRILLLMAAGVCNAVVAVWLAISPPATAYEGSIYAAYPTWLWVVFLLGMASAVLLVLRSAVDGGTDWQYGLAFVCSLYVLFHLLPVFRGWAMYGRGSADALTHVGVARTILETGSIPATDWYPVVHVLIAGLGAFGVPMGSITSVMSAFFTPLYIVSMFLLGRRLLGSRNAGLAVLICSVPLVYAEFNHSLHPAIFSFLLLPLVLAVFIGAYNSDRTLPYVAVLGLFGLTLLLFHPVTTIYFVGMLGVSFVVRASYSRFTDLDLRYSGEIALAGGLTLAWFAWFLQFAQIQRFGRRVLSSLPVVGDSGGSGAGGGSSGSSGSGGGEAASETGSIAAEMFAKVRGIDSIEKLVTGFLTNYGPQFVIAALGVAAIVVTLGWYWSTREFSIEDTWLAAQFGTGVMVTLVGIFLYVVSSDPIRNARYMILFGTLLAGLLLYRSLAGGLPWPSLNGPTVRVLLVVLLLSTAGLSVMTSYSDNYHLTHAEEGGSEWYYDHRVDEVGVAADISYKMREYTEADDYGSSKLRPYGGETSTLDKRFGYANHDSVATAVDGYETYIVTKPYDTTVPNYLDPSVRDQYTYYYESDLQRLGTDRGADRIYSNGGYTIWYVDP